MQPQTQWSNFRTSFQFKLFSVFTLLTAAISILLCTLYINSEIREKRANTRENVRMLARHLAESVRLPLYAGNRDVLQELAEQVADEPEIRAVVISAKDGTVQASIRSNGPAAHAGEDLIVETADVHSSHLVDSVESSLSGGQDATVALIGAIRIERGTTDLSHAIRKMISISVSCTVAFWMAVSLLCHVILRRVTRSFNTLVQGINAMQDGDFTTRIDIDTNDEPGRAAHAVNNLASALQQRSEENIRLYEERLELERQMLHAQKLESLGVMAGGIAHDYNNLLQSILGNIELASIKLAPDSPSRKYIANAMSSGKHAAHLTSLMLTYVGKGFVSKKELNLNDLVMENADLLKTAASMAVSTELRLSANLPPIRADEAHIQQVVMNLIINAAESIVEQPGVVRLTTGVQTCDQAFLAGSLLDEKPAPGRYAFLEVTDNGCGMSEDTMKRLFDPFFTTKFTGRGLGMSAVMGIVKSHGGALFVESEPGKGTTFRVLFPISEPAQAAAAQEDVSALPESCATPERTLSGTALVVDDEKSVLRICSKMVSLLGFTVITACDGIDAVSKFREHADEIALVLMDLTMPNMDGITAMAEILTIRPDAKVILSSGFSKEELSERLASHTPSGFIRKPYSISVLETEILRVMQVVDGHGSARHITCQQEHHVQNM